LDAIGVVCSDLRSTASFYRLVGLDVPDPGAETHLEASGPGGIRIMFDTVEMIRSFSEWSEPTGGRPIALAFLCADAAEVDTVWARVTDAGHDSKAEPFDAPWGQRYATVLDPDGNPVDLFAPL